MRLFDFGNALRIRVYGSGFEHRFVFRYALRIRAWVFGFGDLNRLRAYSSALGVCLDVRQRIVNGGTRDSFGIIQLSGKPGEKRKYCKVSRKQLESRRREYGYFPLVSPGVLMGEWETHVEYHGTSWMDRMSSCMIYTPVIAIS